MDWPVWLDALNLLQLPAVPYTLLVDEDGRIEAVNPTQEAFLAFMEKPARETELQSSQLLDRSHLSSPFLASVTRRDQFKCVPGVPQPLFCHRLAPRPPDGRVAGC